MVRPRARIRGRYDAVGRVYDIVSLERMVYRRPRLRMLQLLAPPPGGIVIDVGCGTGLNLSPLLAALGPNGHVVGVDASASMLAAARRRVRAAGWGNVTLLQAFRSSTWTNQRPGSGTWTVPLAASHPATGPAVQDDEPRLPTGGTGQHGQEGDGQDVVPAERSSRKGRATASPRRPRCRPGRARSSCRR